MRALWSLLVWMLRDQRRALLRGGLLAMLVLMMGAALLGLSGWFITATAAAGLAGTGLVFDVFRPSAGIRLLALGRTGARYGERVLTHDATLRALASLRLRLLSGLLMANWSRLTRLRGAQALNRITADVDALDGLTLRLVLPLVAGITTQVTAFALIWWLVAPSVAAIILGGYLCGAAVVLVLGAALARAASRDAERAAQAHRTQVIDLIGARDDLAVYGQLARERDRAMAHEARRHRAAVTLDRIERTGGAALSLVSMGVIACVIAVAGGLAADGSFAPARAAIAIFAALALMETVAPLRRTLADYGRLSRAAGRVAKDSAAPVWPAPPVAAPPPPLVLDALTYARNGSDRAILKAASLEVAGGETVAITGASGSGKSTLLMIAAGLIAPDRGKVRLGMTQVGDLDEATRHAAITLVPQRANLLQGTIADNLRLAAPDADETALWAALSACDLDGVVRDKGGLDARLGPRGSGLSGGEARRLVLARALLRRPQVLLLDEPTEGLDRPRAARVMANIRAALPDTAILIASHRREEREAAHRTLQLVAGSLV